MAATASAVTVGIATPRARALPAIEVAALVLMIVGLVRRGPASRSDAPAIWGAGALGLLAILDTCRLAWGAGSATLGTTCDVARVIIGVLILTTLMRVELAAQAQAVRRGALAERRRIAGDLHDGIAQDLAFIAANGMRMGEHGEQVAAAAAHALAISRGVISDLSDPSGVSVSEAVEGVAEELAQRFAINITVSCAAWIELTPDVTGDLLRIVREAIANAARHGLATRIAISLEARHGQMSLRIRDNGRGLTDAAAVRCNEGFGLQSMRDRALTFGGKLTTVAGRSGTEILVSWR